MKIAHLTYDLAPGGAECLVENLSSCQSASGHDVTIVCVNALDKPERNHYRNELASGVKVVSLGGTGKLSLAVLMRVARFFHKADFDVVHAHTYPLLTYPVAIFSRKPIVLTFHSVVDYYQLNFVFTAFDKFLFRRGRIKPVTITELCHRSFRTVYGLSIDTVVGNGRCSLQLSPNVEEVKAEIAAYNPDGNPVFVHVARYSQEKNQILLLEAFKLLREQGRDFVLLMIGPGYPQQFIQEAETISGVHVLGTKSNVADYLEMSDYFVMSSTYEGLPLSLLEAMSRGCIPISTPAGGVVDVIKDGVVGYLSPDFTPAAYALTLQKALDCRLVDRDAVIAEYQDKYTIDVCGGRYMDIYKQISA